MLEDKFPPFANDLKQNLDLALGSPELSAPQVWGSALAAAIACRHAPTLTLVESLCVPHLDEKTADAARGAASLMSANNIYWRFWYLVDDKEYISIDPGFSTEVLKNPGIEEVDFECFCLSVSAINNCAGCLKVHSRKLLKLGFSKTQVMHVVRIAAVIHSLAVTEVAIHAK